MALTLNTYAEVDPEAKRAAESKVSEALDIDGTLFDNRNPYGSPEWPGINISFTIEQLRAMLAEAEQREANDAGA